MKIAVVSNHNIEKSAEVLSGIKTSLEVVSIDYDVLDIDNLKSGYGKESFPNGICYEGLFNNNKRVGFGIISFPNGDKYEVNFENCLKDADKTLFFSEGGQLWKKIKE